MKSENSALNYRTAVTCFGSSVNAALPCQVLSIIHRSDGDPKAAPFNLDVAKGSHTLTHNGASVVQIDPIFRDFSPLLDPGCSCLNEGTLEIEFTIPFPNYFLETMAFVDGSGNEARVPFGDPNYGLDPIQLQEVPFNIGGDFHGRTVFPLTPSTVLLTSASFQWSNVRGLKFYRSGSIDLTDVPPEKKQSLSFKLYSVIVRRNCKGKAFLTIVLIEC